MKKKTVFIIDDDKMYLKTIEQKISAIEHIVVYTFTSGESAIKNMKLSPHMVFLDYSLSTTNFPSKTSMGILKEIKRKSPSTKVVIVSGFDNLDYVVTAFKTGASDYILKNPEALGKIYACLQPTS